MRLRGLAFGNQAFPIVSFAVAHRDAHGDRLLLRETRRERFVFLQVDPLHQRLYSGIPARSGVQTFPARTTVIKNRRQGERHGEARAETRYDVLAVETS